MAHPQTPSRDYPTPPPVLDLINTLRFQVVAVALAEPYLIFIVCVSAHLSSMVLPPIASQGLEAQAAQILTNGAQTGEAARGGKHPGEYNLTFQCPMPKVYGLQQ